jgi:putative hydrolase of HD superfamily
MSDTPQPYIFDFVRLLHKFQAVQRDIDVPKDRGENDVEHSYQLAMVAWYIIDRNKLSLDRQKVLEYALAHDLVEAFAGDVNPLVADEETMEQKPEKERQAAERLQTDLPAFPTLHQTIHTYEAKADPESRFVYIIDKILPVMNIHLLGGTWYKDHHVAPDFWFNWLADKLAKVNYDELDDAGFIQDLRSYLTTEAANIFAVSTDGQ